MKTPITPMGKLKLYLITLQDKGDDEAVEAWVGRFHEGNEYTEFFRQVGRDSNMIDARVDQGDSILRVTRIRNKEGVTYNIPLNKVIKITK